MTRSAFGVTTASATSQNWHRRAERQDAVVVVGDALRLQGVRLLLARDVAPRRRVAAGAGDALLRRVAQHPPRPQLLRRQGAARRHGRRVVGRRPDRRAGQARPLRGPHLPHRAGDLGLARPEPPADHRLWDMVPREASTAATRRAMSRSPRRPPPTARCRPGRARCARAYSAQPPSTATTSAQNASAGSPVSALTSPGYCRRLSTVTMAYPPLYLHTRRVYHVHAFIRHNLYGADVPPAGRCSP